ncbi:hypothetical protein FB451DRAFT_1485536 [Mycena latifolia]|nr:hypothetical protein FB451DRAFT_1485536 [Mycena latifolia]
MSTVTMPVRPAIPRPFLPHASPNFLSLHTYRRTSLSSDARAYPLALRYPRRSPLRAHPLIPSWLFSDSLLTPVSGPSTRCARSTACARLGSATAAATVNVNQESYFTADSPRAAHRMRTPASFIPPPSPHRARVCSIERVQPSTTPRAPAAQDIPPQPRAPFPLRTGPVSLAVRNPPAPRRCTPRGRNGVPCRFYSSDDLVQDWSLLHTLASAGSPRSDAALPRPRATAGYTPARCTVVASARQLEDDADADDPTLVLASAAAPPSSSTPAPSKPPTLRPRHPRAGAARRAMFLRRRSMVGGVHRLATVPFLPLPLDPARPPPRRPQRKSSGCGACVHARTPRTVAGSAWCEGVDSKTVVSLGAEYFAEPQWRALELGRRRCGCAVCGNALGTRHAPCPTHTTALPPTSTHAAVRKVDPEPGPTPHAYPLHDAPPPPADTPSTHTEADTQDATPSPAPPSASAPARGAQRIRSATPHEDEHEHENEDLYVRLPLPLPLSEAEEVAMDVDVADARGPDPDPSARPEEGMGAEGDGAHEHEHDRTLDGEATRALRAHVASVLAERRSQTRARPPERAETRSPSPPQTQPCPPDPERVPRARTRTRLFER